MDYDEYDDCLSEDDMLLMYMDEEQRRDMLYVDTYDDILELIDESAGLELYTVAGVMAILDTGPISFDYLDEPPF
jgi:hypothetical protein